MTIVFHNEFFRRHDTGAHPETSARLEAIDRTLAASDALSGCTEGKVAEAVREQLVRVHGGAVLEAARAMSSRGGGYLDPDTVVSKDSYNVALAAAGTAISAVDEVMTGRHRNALCLIRPPGHHATADQSMGFCLFNNIAVAARHAEAKHAASRILIVDWDVHHGNGTQDIFYDVENIVFYSLHRYPFYPGSGAADETGTGKGLGATVNVPITFGTSREKYLVAFESGLERAAAVAKPDLILISAGFDAHAADPVGNLGLATEDYSTMTSKVLAVADLYCAGRVVSCLEGGYDLSALADSVVCHLRELKRPQV